MQTIKPLKSGKQFLGVYSLWFVVLSVNHTVQFRSCCTFKVPDLIMIFQSAAATTNYKLQTFQNLSGAKAFTSTEVFFLLISSSTSFPVPAASDSPNMACPPAITRFEYLL